MTDRSEGSLGYMKYCGKLVEDGVFDARKSAQALLGFDEAIRFFAYHQNKNLKDIDFELPVRIQKGSWEITIPKALTLLASGAGMAGGVFLTAYLAKAGQKMAENDFDDIGFKTVITKSLKAMQWIIRIGKHTGSTANKSFENVKFRNGNTEIGIPNNKGELLWVPDEYLELYYACPKYQLSQLVDLVEEERSLSFGVEHNGKEVVETVTQKHKPVFLPPKELDVFFPELQHGMEVVLRGGFTRGNESTNTMGFK